MMDGGSGFSGSSTRGSSVRPSGSAACTSSSDRQAASQYGPAANYLNSRGIFAVETEYVNDFDSPERCRGTYQAFLDLLLAHDAHGRVANHLPLYEALLDVLDRTYSSDIKFNEDLFKAVGVAIQGLATKAYDPFKFRSPVLCTDNLIVLDPKKRLVIGGTEYAAGLARGTALPNKDRRNDDDDDDDAPRVHAAVVLRRAASSRRDDDWEVWNVLAVVGCEVQGKGVRDLAKNSDGNVDHRRLRPLEARTQGPLALVIMDTAAHGLRGAAALGWMLPERIPFAVVSCKTETGDGGDSKVQKGSSWVHGNLVVPEACGYPYDFNVDAYGNLEEETKLKNHSSLAAYLHVLAHGLKLASDWLTNVSEAQPPLLKNPAPQRMSGLHLHFGTNRPLTRDGTHVATIVLVATPVSKYGKSGLRISQGELFEATVNLHKLRASLSTREEVFWCRDNYDDEETSVLIKVSSRSCFNFLVPPVSAYLYGIENDVRMLRQDVRDVLSRSLYGFYVTPGKHGLVQLLPNLVEQGYMVLRPQHWLFEDTWSTLWDAFAKLVTETLVPLARYDILHADLRAGYDVTSNVLYNPTTGSMRLIDLDSLCDFNSLLGMVVTRDKRNFHPIELPANLQKTALGFVLGQVMCVSEAWHGEIRDADVHASRIIIEAANSNDDAKGGGATATVDENLIAKVLDHYRTNVKEKYGGRRRRRRHGAGPSYDVASAVP